MANSRSMLVLILLLLISTIIILCASQMERYLLENSIFLLVLTSLSVHNSNRSTYFQSAGSLLRQSRFSLC